MYFCNVYCILVSLQPAELPDLQLFYRVLHLQPGLVHMPCILCTLIHCIYCTLQGRFLVLRHYVLGYWAAILENQGQSWNKLVQWSLHHQNQPAEFFHSFYPFFPFFRLARFLLSFFSILFILSILFCQLVNTIHMILSLATHIALKFNIVAYRVVRVR